MHQRVTPDARREVRLDVRERYPRSPGHRARNGPSRWLDTAVDPGVRLHAIARRNEHRARVDWRVKSPGRFVDRQPLAHLDRSCVVADPDHHELRHQTLTPRATRSTTSTRAGIVVSS